MAAPFGFSVGDFIAVGKLIAQVVDELRENGEACSDYNSIVIELEALQRALKQLQALKPAKRELLQLTSIRATVCACQRPLQQFLDKISKFQHRLGTFNSKNQKWKGLPRRMQFRVMFKDDIKELRSFLASHIATINLLLMTQAVSSISLAEVDRHDMMSGLEEKVLAHRKMLDNVGANVDLSLQGQQRIQRQLIQHGSALDAIGNREDDIQEQLRSQGDVIQAVKTATEHVPTQMTSILGTTTQTLGLITSGFVHLRQISDQLHRMLQICCAFTAEMRGAMSQILQLFSSIHAMLQRIERELPARPHLPIVQLTTALEETIALPYQVCQQWAMFAAVMKAICMDRPWSEQISDGTFWILNTRGGKLLQEISWQHAVLQDDHLSMFLIVKDPADDGEHCPTWTCTGKTASRLATKAQPAPSQFSSDKLHHAGHHPPTTDRHSGFYRQMHKRRSGTRRIDPLGDEVYEWVGHGRNGDVPDIFNMQCMAYNWDTASRLKLCTLCSKESLLQEWKANKDNSSGPNVDEEHTREREREAKGQVVVGSNEEAGYIGVAWHDEVELGGRGNG